MEFVSAVAGFLNCFWGRWMLMILRFGGGLAGWTWSMGLGGVKVPGVMVFFEWNWGEREFLKFCQKK